MKRFLSAVLAAAMLMTAAGCGASSSSGGNASGSVQGKVTLNYYTWSDEKTYIPQEVAAFEKENPNIKINTIVIPSSDYDQKMQVLLSGGTNVDLLDVRTIQKLSDYSKGNSIVNMSELISRDKFDTSPYGTLFQKYTLNNTHYGLPVRGSCWMLLYNKDVFDKEKIAYPGQMTWTEFEALAKKMTHGSGTSKQYGTYMTTWVYNQMAIQKGVSLLDDNPVSALSYSLKVFNQVFNVDKSAMDVAQQKAVNADADAEFESGKYAMMINGDWTFSMLDADIKAGKAKLNYDAAPLPVPEGVQAGTSHGTDSFVSIAASSKNKEACWKYAKFLCGEKGATIMAQTKNFPAYHSDAVRNTYIKAVGKAGAKTVFDSKMVQEAPANSHLSDITEAYNEQAELYLLGEKSLDDAMNTFIKKRSSILNKS
ncbi:MAG: sugar ABC transporter substrate-binding protein [Oscillospiraceae bacterium]|nr:sugar ABC transporter substrate-binding protein [Oscillospiraceae bacterium]MDD3261479.1 sugar ABC transporter substrate-binding protein [Oscillospiraceae bacterium]